MSIRPTSLSNTSKYYSKKSEENTQNNKEKKSASLFTSREPGIHLKQKTEESLPRFSSDKKQPATSLFHYSNLSTKDKESHQRVITHSKLCKETDETGVKNKNKSLVLPKLETTPIKKLSAMEEFNEFRSQKPSVDKNNYLRMRQKTTVHNLPSDSPPKDYYNDKIEKILGKSATVKITEKNKHLKSLGYPTNYLEKNNYSIYMASSKKF